MLSKATKFMKEGDDLRYLLAVARARNWTDASLIPEGIASITVETEGPLPDSDEIGKVIGWSVRDANGGALPDEFMRGADLIWGSIIASGRQVMESPAPDTNPDGEAFVERILGYAPQINGSPFLEAVSQMMDGHDAKGMIFIAKEGLAAIPEDDACYATLQKVVEFGADRKVFDAHDAKGIIFICDEAIKDKPTSGPKM
jgi:hypothetical protein